MQKFQNGAGFWTFNRRGRRRHVSTMFFLKVEKYLNFRNLKFCRFFLAYSRRVELFKRQFCVFLPPRAPKTGRPITSGRTSTTPDAALLFPTPVLGLRLWLEITHFFFLVG